MIRQPAESNGDRLERIRKTLLVGGLLLLFLPSSVSAFELSEEPGYHARQPFDAGSLVDVNLYNLNVVAREFCAFVGLKDPDFAHECSMLLRQHKERTPQPFESNPNWNLGLGHWLPLM